MIVLNVTFFILLLLEVIGEWAGSVRGMGHPNFFFFNVYFTVNIFLFRCKAKMWLFVLRCKVEKCILMT